MTIMNDEKPALDTASRASDLEKDPDTKVAVGFEDPDEGLSEEERAKIVRDPCLRSFVPMHA
jgi:hypothetical protein